MTRYAALLLCLAAATAFADRGALNPAVTQANIAQTICVPGYAKSVRPATSYTNGVNYDPFGRLFNVAPTTQIPVLRLTLETGELQLAIARWGLIPFWWKQSKPPGFTFNTRIEEAATKPMWREVIKTSRCLIPAVGWYEWKEIETTDPATGEIKKVKQPYFLHLPGNRLLAFAGMMSSWTSPEGKPAMLTCSILTRAAEGPAADIHDRIPVLLPEDAQSAWVDPKQTDSEKALTLVHEKAVTAVEHYRVSPRVNNSRNEGAELIEPLDVTS